MNTKKITLAVLSIFFIGCAIYRLGVGGGSLIAAFILLIWGLVSLSKNNPNDHSDDDNFHDTFPGGTLGGAM